MEYKKETFYQANCGCVYKLASVNKDENTAVWQRIHVGKGCIDMGKSIFDDVVVNNISINDIGNYIDGAGSMREVSELDLAIMKLKR